jgi:hypothetical protein
MESSTLTTDITYDSMTTKLFIAACLTGLAWSICYAQPNTFQTITNWGESLNGVHLSINVSTNVIDIGSTAFISAKIQNSSTNTVSMIERNPLTEFDITLSSNSGKKYNLTPDIRNMPVRRSFTVNLNPGEVQDWRIPVSFGKAIEPGDYLLKAKRNIIATGGNGGALVSNLVKVQIK